MTPERAIQTEILRAFATRPDLRLWRANCGAAVDARGHLTRFGVRGQADISGLMNDGTGRRVEIEVKTATGRQSEEQRRFGEMIIRAGGIYIVARSVEDVELALRPFLGGAAAAGKAGAA